MSSSTIEVTPTKKVDKRPLPWSLWFRQIRAIFRLEIEKNFLGRRSILLYLLALLPIVPLVLLAPFTPPGREWQDFTQYNMIFAVFYGGRCLPARRFFFSLRVFLNTFRRAAIVFPLVVSFFFPVLPGGARGGKNFLCCGTGHV